MARGIIYLMSATALEGVVKIGKTNIDQFDSRMRGLEKDGYRCQQLKKEFAIIVDDFDEKEVLLHDLFDKSRIGDSELFALDKDLAMQLLSSLKGQIIYPKQDQEVIFAKATTAVEEKKNYDEQYHFNRMGEKMKALYLKLKDLIKSNFPDTDIKYNKHYLTFTKNGKNVCDLETCSKNYMLLSICIKNESIDDPQHLCRDMRNTGHHGNGDYVIRIVDDKTFQFLPALIKQAYDKR